MWHTKLFYENYISLARYLTIMNSYNKAYWCLNKIIFRIPINFLDTKERAFKLMYKITKALGKPVSRIYLKLVKQDCRLIKHSDYNSILHTFGGEMKAKKILEKWVKRL